MGFMLSRFVVGDRVMVSGESPRFVEYRGLTGTIAEVGEFIREPGDRFPGRFPHWDYNYRVCFDFPSDAVYSDYFVRLADNTWIPGFFMCPLTSTLLLRKLKEERHDVDTFV